MSHFIVSLIMLLILFPLASFADMGLSILEQRLTLAKQANASNKVVYLKQVLPRVSLEETKLKKNDSIVRGVRLEDSSIINPQELENLVGGYIGRPLTTQTEDRVVSTVNQFYRDQGYLYSFVEVRQSDHKKGILYLHANEAKIQKLQLSGNQGIQDSIVVESLSTAISPALNKNTLQESMMHLRQLEAIEDVKATLFPLGPNNQYGLMLNIEQRRKNQYGLYINNHQSPSVGSERLQFDAKLNNRLGLGEQLGLQFNLSKGIYQVGMNYQMPLSWKRTSLNLQSYYSQGQIVEGDLQQLDINNTVNMVDLNLGRTFYMLGLSHAIHVGFQWRKMNTRLGELDFIIDNPQNSLLVGQWISHLNLNGKSWRQRLEFLQALYGETDNAPISSRLKINGDYTINVKVLGNDKARIGYQGQWALGALGNLDRYSVGGIHSLRGYREGKFSVENLIIGNFEYQLPLLVHSNLTGFQKIDVVSFFDIAILSQQANDDKVLTSVGAGLTWRFQKSLDVDVVWAYGLNRKYIDSGNLQDYGVQFNMTYQF